MELNIAFGLALKQIRNGRKLTQEDFAVVSSRTYLSTLERGLKSPTLEKIDQLAGALDVHPLTILVATYIGIEGHSDIEHLFKRVREELKSVTATKAQSS